MIRRSTYRADRASWSTLDARCNMAAGNECRISVSLEAHFAGLVSKLFLLAVLLLVVLFTFLFVDQHVTVFFTGIVVVSRHALCWLHFYVASI